MYGAPRQAVYQPQPDMTQTALSTLFANLNVKSGKTVEEQNTAQLNQIKDLIFKNMKEQELRDANDEHQDLTEFLTVVVFPCG